MFIGFNKELCVALKIVPITNLVSFCFDAFHTHRLFDVILIDIIFSVIMLRTVFFFKDKCYFVFRSALSLYICLYIILPFIDEIMRQSENYHASLVGILSRTPSSFFYFFFYIFRERERERCIGTRSAHWMLYQAPCRVVKKKVGNDKIS